MTKWQCGRQLPPESNTKKYKERIKAFHGTGKVSWQDWTEQQAGPRVSGFNISSAALLWPGHAMYFSVSPTGNEKVSVPVTPLYFGNITWCLCLFVHCFVLVLQVHS